METKEIVDKSNEMLENLVNSLGLDGEYYVSVNKCPVWFMNLYGDGKFYTANTRELEELLSKYKIDEKRKKYIFSEGLIAINKNLLNKGESANLFVTLIHERLHANRMLLLNTQFNDNENINSIFYDDGRFVKNSDSKQPYYADASQEILKASIDTSRKTTKKYSSMSDEEKDGIYLNDSKYDSKMEQQYLIDESLVELMSIVAYLLYTKKTNDIMGVIKDINARYDSKGIRAITNIILRHGNLELFKWMLDPLSYQLDDVNYDFFGHYMRKDDLEDLKNLTQDEELMFDDDEIDKIANEQSGRRR